MKPVCLTGSRAPIASKSNAWARPPFRHKLLHVLVAGTLTVGIINEVRAQPTTTVATLFNEDLFSAGSKTRIDTTRFSRGNPILPGTFRIDLYANATWAGRPEVVFETPAGAEDAVPCFDRALLLRAGIDVSKLDPSVTEALADGRCHTLDTLVPDAVASFDFAEQRLNLSVPQIFMQRRARGQVDPEMWDKGIPAAVLGYSFNSYHTNNATGQQTFSYLGLNTSVSMGGWNLRQDSALSWQSAGQHKWQNIATYAQHPITSARSLLTVGDAYTSGELFDSVGFRGVQLASDPRMMSESLRGYAPVIRGIAQTNAKVTVRQNGYVLYELTVAPGPFEINDLYPTAGGDLDVTVNESDGRQRSFSVPYAAIAQLLRPGVSYYNVTAGQVRSATSSTNPKLLQLTLQHGLSNLITGYTGLVASAGYWAALAGSALNTPVGAVAMDVTQAHTELTGADSRTGTSLRLQYSKFIRATDTNLTLAAYRYNTSGYLGLQDALLLREFAQRGADPELVDRQRSRFELTVNQKLGGKWGALFLSGSTRNYWNRAGSSTQFQMGYSNSVGRSTYNIQAIRARDEHGRTGNSYFLSWSMPFDLSGHSVHVSSNINRNADGRTAFMETASGVAGQDNQLTYGVSVGHTLNSSSALNEAQSGNDSSGNLYGQYRAQYASFTGSYSQGQGYRQMSVGATGAMVLHAGGLTLAQAYGNTMAVIEAPGAAGARVTNLPGVRLDSRGYAVVPNLTPYYLNTVQLDPKGLPMSVELTSTSQQVAPYAGAVTKLKFDTVEGQAAFIHGTFRDGYPLPFGADVLDSQGKSVGAVGQAGRIFARGITETGSLQVKWGTQPGQSCLLAYQLPPASASVPTSHFKYVEGSCPDSHPDSATTASPPVREQVVPEEFGPVKTIISQSASIPRPQ